MSKSKLFYEEVNIGDEIPHLGPLTWNTIDIVRFSLSFAKSSSA